MRYCFSEGLSALIKPFFRLIRKVKMRPDTKKRVVILIDEYDKPMLQAIGNEELGEKYRG